MKHRTQTLYRFIIRYKREHDGNSPSTREIAGYLGTSTSVVNYHLDKLEQQCLISRTGDSQSRSIAVAGARWLDPKEAAIANSN